MSTGYLLQDFPNPTFGQFGWPRTKVSGVIGVHTTESGVDFDGPDGGAENTAAFIRRRTDPGGYHSLADADSRIKLVHPRYAAWADTTNNAHAMSVSAAMNAARWRDLAPERAAAIVRNLGVAAAELVRDAMAAGLLATPTPARRITAEEAIKGSRAGFYGHGETNPGRRYDPGTNFDWDLFLTTYASAIGGGINFQGSTPIPMEDEEMALTDETKQWLRDNLLNKDDGGQLRRDLAYQNETLLNKDDGAYMNNTRDAQSSAIMEALGKTLNKDDGGYIVNLVEAIKPGAMDPEAAAEALVALVPEAIAAATLEALARKLENAK